MSKAGKYETFREIVLAYPGVEEATAYGTPIFKVRKKMLARRSEDADIIVIKINLPLRSSLIEGAPERFFVTPHYEPHELMLVNLKKVDADDLKYLVEQAWRMVATTRLIENFDKTDL